jgi:hypothetical protein
MGPKFNSQTAVKGAQSVVDQGEGVGVLQVLGICLGGVLAIEKELLR